MRRGVDRAGSHLYPAFPYNHFRLTSDDDLAALYAFLMSREGVKRTAPANALIFPLQFRPLIAAWKLLYLPTQPARADTSWTDVMKRGAYLAEGLGHCGGCHTPRNALGAERVDRHFSGGFAEGWVAYAINQQSPAPVPWTVPSLAFYLRNGWEAQHGVARGPMTYVTANLATLPASDIRAIATYVIRVMGHDGALSPAPGGGVRAILKSGRLQPTPSRRERLFTSRRVRVATGAVGRCPTVGYRSDRVPRSAPPIRPTS